MINNSKNLSLEQKIDRILELLENMSQKNDSMFGDTISDEEMYKKAYEATISAGKVSTSYLQRKLGIGYSRSAGLVDMLEQRGVVSPSNGSKPRTVIDKPAQSIL